MTFRPVDSPLRPVDIQGYVAFRPVDSPYYDRSIYRSISHFDRSILYYDRSIYKSIRHFDRSVYRSIYRSLSHIDRSIIKSWLSIMAAIMAPMCNIHHYLLHQHPLKNGCKYEETNLGYWHHRKKYTPVKQLCHVYPSGHCEKSEKWEYSSIHHGCHSVWGVQNVHRL